jgi:integrase
MALVRRIVAQMKVNAETFGAKKGSLSALRAEILALTGMRAGELKNLVATDVRLEGLSPVVSIRTLKGGKNRRVPLNADAVAAFRAFRKADAFGPFSTASLRNSLHRACKGVLDENGKPTPPIHPHVLRHSFAS